MSLTESKTAAYNESSQIAATERVAASTITRSPFCIGASGCIPSCMKPEKHQATTPISASESVYKVKLRPAIHAASERVAADSAAQNPIEIPTAIQNATSECADMAAGSQAQRKSPPLISWRREENSASTTPMLWCDEGHAKALPGRDQLPRQRRRGVTKVTTTHLQAAGGHCKNHSEVVDKRGSSQASLFANIRRTPHVADTSAHSATTMPALYLRLGKHI